MATSRRPRLTEGSVARTLVDLTARWYWGCLVCRRSTSLIPFLSGSWEPRKGIFGAAALSYIVTGVAAYFWLKKSLPESMEYDFLQRIVATEGIEDHPDSLGYWISRLQGHARNYLERTLSQYHLDGRTLAFLTALLRDDGLSQHELSEQLRVNESMTSRVISRLVDLGYVRRETVCQADGGERLYITEAARQISPDVKRVLQTWSELLSQGFDAEERAMALTLLQRMNKNAVDWSS